ncbi:MAG TPA: hypothetical protein VFI25_17730 [Planctomycetota bacterium]|jgi:hypothetical protein|nr:hypothetical protein [Planctomycetota bacterium]
MRLARAGGALAFAVALLAFPAAWLLDRAATEAVPIDPFPPEKVLVNRELDAPSRDDPAFAQKVAALYGNPLGEPMRVLFVPRERFLRPVEDPSLTLLPLDKAKGEEPLQIRTVRFLARWTALGAGAVGVGLLLLDRRLPPRAAA